MRVLKQVAEEEVPALIGQEPVQRQESDATANMMLLALRALSQRAFVSLVALRNLALAGSVCWLMSGIIASPSVLQLVGVGMYGAFTLAVMWIWR